MTEKTKRRNEGKKRLSRLDAGKAKRRLKRHRAVKVSLLVCLIFTAVALPAWFINPGQVGKAIYHAVGVGIDIARDEKNDAVKKKEGRAAEKREEPYAQGQKATSPASTGDSKESLTFIGLGDMLFDRRVASAINSEGIDYIFSDVKDVLQAADIVAGNLECPVSYGGEPKVGKDVTFRGLPQAAQGMKDAGINVVSLANNHMLDYGYDALRDTIELLNKAGIAYAGAGLDHTSAHRPAVVNVGDKRVAFLAYSSILPEGFLPASDKPGVAGTRPDWSIIEESIESAADEHDYVIVSFHWGVEYRDYPEKYQREFARKVIDAGADLVLGHHPHVIQGLEMYKGKLIAYSMGGFVFDHYSKKTGETFILKVALSTRTTSKVEIIPVYMEPNGKPKIVTGNQAREILDRLKTISIPFNTVIEINEDRAELKIQEPASSR